MLVSFWQYRAHILVTNEPHTYQQVIRLHESTLLVSASPRKLQLLQLKGSVKLLVTETRKKKITANPYPRQRRIAAKPDKFRTCSCLCICSFSHNPPQKRKLSSKKKVSSKLESGRSPVRSLSAALSPLKLKLDLPDSVRVVEFIEKIVPIEAIKLVLAVCKT